VRSLLVLSLVSTVASAQGFELERISLNPGARHTFFAQTGDALEPMSLRVSLLGHYQHLPLVYVVDGSAVGAYVRSRWTTHLVAAFGVHEYVEVSAQVPVVLSQAGDDLSRFGLVSVPAIAMGAPWLQVRSGFLRQGEKAPLDLGLSLALSLPLGSTEALTKDPGAGLAFVPKLGAGRAFGPIRLGLEVGALIRGTQVLSPASPEVRDEVGSHFSGALAISTVDLPVNAELTARLTAPFTSTGVSAEILAAVRYSVLRQLELSVLGGPGIGKAPGTPAFRVLFGVTWTPSFES
jgi:hypothetical protein